MIKSLESKQAEKVTFQDNEYDLNVVKDALESINAPVAKNAGVKGVTKAIAVSYTHLSVLPSYFASFRFS